MGANLTKESYEKGIYLRVGVARGWDFHRAGRHHSDLVVGYGFESDFYLELLR